MATTDPGDERMRQRLAPRLGRGSGDEHPEPEILVAHASGELGADENLAVVRHLLACSDGRCNTALRFVVAGARIAGDSLYARREREAISSTDAAIAFDGAESARTVECSDELWGQFQQAAAAEGRPVDALLNDAMKLYWRQQSSMGSSVALSSPLARAGEVTMREVRREPIRDRNTPTQPYAFAPRAPVASRRVAHPSTPQAGRLSVLLEGERYEVTKQRFVVGRGERSSDLSIDDPGVSRQHAVIERSGEAYFLVDMGSTNGIEYQGERIARKEISDGDRVRIGAHELEFVFG